MEDLGSTNSIKTYTAYRREGEVTIKLNFVDTPGYEFSREKQKNWRKKDKKGLSHREWYEMIYYELKARFEECKRMKNAENRRKFQGNFDYNDNFDPRVQNGLI